MSDWSGRDVFVTGHTGFKGSWLSLWLQLLGSRVHGYALDPPSEPSMFDVASVAKGLFSDTRADLDDFPTLTDALCKASPEVVFHLAAQPLVRASYTDPIGTFRSNVLGTAHLLEAVRHCSSVKAVVVVTTDKVYQNHGWVHPYRENDSLGGRDPYSASKAAAELVTASMRESFFGEGDVRIATARAGNVIGGGDWATDRLVPDCLRSFSSDQAVSLRFPRAIRPWQHVLEPLGGYLELASSLLGENGRDIAKAWNFGPDPKENVEVGTVAECLARLWGDDARVSLGIDTNNPHEAALLTLDNSAARYSLGWTPKFSLEETLDLTVRWHKAWLSSENMWDVTRHQIDGYRNATV